MHFHLPQLLNILFSCQVTNFAFEQKNPKNQAEALNWLAGAIRDFGLK
jgi:cytoskeleton-associated protein 5